GNTGLGNGLRDRGNEPPHASVAPVPLLAPGIAVVVVANRLPEARLVLVLRAVVPERDRGLPVDHVGQGEVGGVVALGEGDDVPGVGVDLREERVDGTPVQRVSNLDHFVTQWMSTAISSTGNTRNSGHVHLATRAPVSSVTVKSQSSRSNDGVGPALRTG